MDAVRTISTVATQLTAQEKKGMFVAIATPISAALFALIGYAHAKANAKALSIYCNSNIKSLNSQIKLIEQKVRFNTAIVQLAESQSKESSSNQESKVQILSNQILINQFDEDEDGSNMFDICQQHYDPIKNHIIKLAFVGAILPAAILALYEKGAAIPATETLQVISNLGAKALRNKGKSICLIVVLIAAKRFHNKAERHHNTYLEELSETGKHFRIPGFGKKNSSGTYYESAKKREEEYPATSTTEQDQNWDNDYPNDQQPRKASLFSSITNWFSNKKPDLDD